MKKTKVYLDASVIGGCLDKEFKQYSNLLVAEFISGKKIALLSRILFAEISKAPQPVQDVLMRIQKGSYEFLENTPEVDALAQKYIRHKILDQKWFDDATHIATATVYKADVLVSWNFKHIVNYNKIHLIHSLNLKEGYPAIEIRTPTEAVDYE